MSPPRLDARESRARADALMRRRSDVTGEVVAAELAGADPSELRRWLVGKLAADDLEPEEPARIALVAAHAGLGPARRDVERAARDASRHELAREAAQRVLQACGGADRRR